MIGPVEIRAPEVADGKGQDGGADLWASTVVYLSILARWGILHVLDEHVSYIMQEPFEGCSDLGWDILPPRPGLAMETLVQEK